MKKINPAVKNMIQLLSYVVLLIVIWMVIGLIAFPKPSTVERLTDYVKQNEKVLVQVAENAMDENVNPGIMTRLDKMMTDLGYKYFDWNVSSGDAGENNETNEIVDNIIAGCTGMKSSIVLQHDIKDYSIAAVEQVIIWGLNNGYTFRALDLTSPDAHHGLNN